MATNNYWGLTSAELCRLARECENRFDWIEAANCWWLASARYPRVPYEHTLDATRRMHDRAAKCESLSKT